MAAPSPAIAGEGGLALTTFLGRLTQLAIPSKPNAESLSANALSLSIDFIFHSLPSFSIGTLCSYATSEEFDTLYGAQLNALIVPGFYCSLWNVLIRADVGLGMTWGYQDSAIPNSPLFSFGMSFLFPLHYHGHVGTAFRPSHHELEGR